ncbi:MAG: dehydratase [Chloroflexi bacterium]|nr:dehydratase [Chloroflexota bacterium]|tara:strand:- start:145 stop:1356 length:1212 start_codon:yes stop_codon:yes gene_type:complete
MVATPVISRVETFRNPEYPMIVWVQIHSSDGFVGLGESSFSPDAIEAYIHSDISDYLLGKNPDQLDLHWDNMARRMKVNRGRSVDASSISAVDMALWDLYARRNKQPLYQVLGGLARDKIRVYNTCAGYSYGVKAGRTWKAGEIDYRPEQPYEDYHAFMTDAGALADDLMSQGFTAMKIWPFDKYSNESNGQFIHATDLEAGTEPFYKIREAVGNKMDVMVEMHSLWNLSSAKRIAKSVEPTSPFWFEDPVPMNNIDTLAEFRKSTDIATTASETVSTRWAFREMFEKQAMTICMLDISWVGGISEAKRIAAMADAFHMPIAPHDCVGPVTLMFSVHLSLNATNALIQETVRAYNNTWYKEIVDQLPNIENGYALPPEGYGTGTNLLRSFLSNPSTSVVESAL